MPKLTIEQVLSDLNATQQKLINEKNALEGEIASINKNMPYWKKHPQLHRTNLRNGELKLSDNEQAIAFLKKGRLDIVATAIRYANLLKDENVVIDSDKRDLAIQHLANINYFVNPTEKSSTMRIMGAVLVVSSMVLLPSSIISFIALTGLAIMGQWAPAVALYSTGLLGPVFLVVAFSALLMGGIGAVFDYAARAAINPLTYAEDAKKACCAVQQVLKQFIPLKSVVEIDSALSTNSSNPVFPAAPKPQTGGSTTPSPENNKGPNI